MIKQKFFMKLLTVYLLIMCSYTLIITAVFYYKNNEIIKLELEKKDAFFLQQIRDKIDTKLNVAFNQINSLQINEDIQKHIRSSSLDYFTITRIYSYMSKYQSAFSNLGYNLSVSKLKDNMVIGSMNTSTITNYFKNIGLDGVDQTLIYDAFQQENQRPYVTLRSSALNGISLYKSYLTIIKKEILDVSGDFYTLLTFDEKMLLPELSYTPNEAFFILRNNEIISSEIQSNDTEISSLLTEDFLASIKANETVKLQTPHYNIVAIGSHVLDWNYVYVYSKDEIKLDLKKLISSSILIYILFAVLSAAIGFLITKNVYKPIRGIVNVFKIFEKKDSPDELSYIKETAVKISLANENLRQIIDNNVIPLKVKFMKDLILGLLPEEYIEEHLTQYELDFLKNKSTLVVFEYANYIELSNSFSKEMILSIQVQVLTILKEQVEQEFHCEVFELDGKRFVMLMAESDLSKIKKTLNNALINIEVNFELSITAIIGSLNSPISDFEKSFGQIMQAMEHATTIGMNTVIAVEDLNVQVGDSFYYPLETERDIITYAIQGKGEKVLELVHQVLSNNFQKRKLSKQALSAFTFNIIGTINRIMQALDKNIEDFFSEGTIIYIELKMCESIEQLEEKMLEIFQTILSNIVLQREKINTTIADDLLSYIHANYNIDISLIDIAQHFNLSHSYTSTLFKNCTGQTFKDYLNIYRVKIAKEMLNADETIKIKDLSQAVGYINVSSFIRMFNRYEGVSPGQYIKNKNQES